MMMMIYHFRENSLQFMGDRALTVARRRRRNSLPLDLRDSNGVASVAEDLPVLRRTTAPIDALERQFTYLQDRALGPTDT